MASYLGIGSIVFAAALSAAVFAAPAHAQNATAALTEASKMLEKGVPVKAIELIDSVLKSGKVPAELAAKAMLMRAQAQEKLGKQAFALADYNSALWMEGLSARDKAEAEKGRDRILGKLGVDGESEKASSDTPASGKAASASWDTTIRTSPSEERTGGIGSVFSGLFGSSSEAKEEPQPKAQQRVAASAKPERAEIRPAKAERPARVATVEPATVATAAEGDPSGNFAIQFAALRSEDGAIYEVDRIEKRYGAELAGRTPSVKILATSDGGTLYKIVAEPYEKGEATAICELLKTKGLSCMLISR